MNELPLKIREQGSRTMATVIETKPVSNPGQNSLEALELGSRIQIRSEICRYLIKALGCSTAACFGLIVLQGFHPLGFQMDAALLKSLCGATIVQSGVLLAVFTNAVWQKKSKNADKKGQHQRSAAGIKTEKIMGSTYQPAAHRLEGNLPIDAPSK